MSTEPSSTFTGELNANGIKIGGSLHLRGGAEFKEIDLIRADIGGDLDAEGSIFTGKFNANSLKTGDSVFLRGGAEFKEIDLGNANIGGNLDAEGSIFTGKFNANSLNRLLKNPLHKAIFM